MIDQPRASRLAKEGFDCWQSGQLEQAVTLYVEALSFADPKHYALSDYHGEFAGVLSALGRFSEAGEQYKAALSVQLAQDEDDFSSGVVVARYFLAQHYLQQNQPEVALETVAPSLKEGVSLEWILRLINAYALKDLGRANEALLEARRTLALAPSDEKREELTRSLTEKLGEIHG